MAATVALALLAWSASPAAAGGAPAWPVAALPPGQAVCRVATGALRSEPDASGYAQRSVDTAPVWLSPDVLAYLQTARRPEPHVAALVAVRLDGRVLWRRALGPAADPSDVTAVGGALDVAVWAGPGRVRVERRSPGTGALEASVTLPWPAGGAAPQLLPDGDGGLLMAAAVSDRGAALDGLGAAPTPVWDLSAGLATRWHAVTAGAVVAVGGGAVVAGYVAGAAVRLSGLAAVGGRALWHAAVPLGGAPVGASFAVGGSTLVWAAVWRGGGMVQARPLAGGAPRWQAATDRTAWLAFDGLALGGLPPWGAPAPVDARGEATGARSAARWPEGDPLAALGARILIETPPGTHGAPALVWVGPAPGGAERATVATTAGPTGAPPWYVACLPAGAVLVSPWAPGAVWTVAARP